MNNKSLILKALIPFFGFLSLLFLLNSCKTGKEKDKDARVLSYEVSYREEKAGSVPTRILPDKMKLVFAGDMAVNQIEGFLGQFSLTYIADLRKEKVVTLLKLFDKKYYYQGEKGELPCGIDRMEGMKVLPLAGSKDIIGFEAKLHQLILPDGDTLVIASTDELEVESPNITTPYRELDDVLLQFYTKLSVLEMVLKATEYTETSLSADFFSIPDEYQEINRITMEKAIEELFK